MNYPVWSVPFGSQWLIAAVAVLHVFISHFAIGGGLFLVAVETRTHRHFDPGLSDWLRRHTRFFVLLTVVLGALTGVGIWFTIGLISPEATSNLIHVFVWVWAIEWVFFAVEILSILVYAATWDLLSPATHLLVGWAYIISSFMSLVVIDGILSFQLTPGKWIQNHSLWSAFFNPGYAPSLLARILVCLMLGGLFALWTVSWSQDRTLKRELARYAAHWVWIPALGLAPLMMWLARTVPPAQRLLLKENPILHHAASYMLPACLLLILITVVLALLRPRNLKPWMVAPLLLVAFAAIGAAEWTREDLREPYLISGYLYINQVPVRLVDTLKEKGLLASSPWFSAASVTPENEAQVGRELFLGLCSPCHTPRRGFNPIGPKLTGLDHAFVSGLVAKTDLMRAGMPPFPGKPEEASALARYLMNNTPETPVSNDGLAVWHRRCAPCHSLSGRFRPVKEAFLDQKPVDIADTIGSIDKLNDLMPAWTGNDIERKALSDYLATACTGPHPGGVK